MVLEYKFKLDDSSNRSDIQEDSLQIPSLANKAQDKIVRHLRQKQKQLSDEELA
jgi:hypothetical protein